MAILNKTNTDTVKLELNSQVEVKKSEPYLMYFNKKSHGDQIVGIWFNDTFSFIQATKIITMHLNQLKKSDVVKANDSDKNTTNQVKQNNGAKQLLTKKHRDEIKEKSDKHDKHFKSEKLERIKEKPENKINSK